MKYVVHITLLMSAAGYAMELDIPTISTAALAAPIPPPSPINPSRKNPRESTPALKTLCIKKMAHQLTKNNPNCTKFWHPLTNPFTLPIELYEEVVNHATQLPTVTDDAHQSRRLLSTAPAYIQPMVATALIKTMCKTVKGYENSSRMHLLLEINQHLDPNTPASFVAIDPQIHYLALRELIRNDTSFTQYEMRKLLERGINPNALGHYQRRHQTYNALPLNYAIAKKNTHAQALLEMYGARKQ